jgi:hypothetical protein
VSDRDEHRAFSPNPATLPRPGTEPQPTSESSPTTASPGFGGAQLLTRRFALRGLTFTQRGESSRTTVRLRPRRPVADLLVFGPVDSVRGDAAVGLVTDWSRRCLVMSCDAVSTCSAVAFFMTCAYTRLVTVGELWPRINWTISIGTPPASRSEHAPCRVSCSRMGGRPQALACASKAPVIDPGRSGLPSIWLKIRSWST